MNRQVLEALRSEERAQATLTEDENRTIIESMGVYDICLMLTRIFLGQEEPRTALNLANIASSKRRRGK